MEHIISAYCSCHEHRVTPCPSVCTSELANSIFHRQVKAWIDVNILHLNGIITLVGHLPSSRQSIPHIDMGSHHIRVSHLQAIGYQAIVTQNGWHTRQARIGIIAMVYLSANFHISRHRKCWLDSVFYLIDKFPYLGMLIRTIIVSKAIGHRALATVKHGVFCRQNSIDNSIAAILHNRRCRYGGIRYTLYLDGTVCRNAENSWFHHIEISPRILRTVNCVMIVVYRRVTRHGSHMD